MGELLLAARARRDVGGDADDRRPVLPDRRRVRHLEHGPAEVDDLADGVAGQRAPGGPDDLRHVRVDLEQRAADDLAGLEADGGERLPLGQGEHAVGVEGEQDHRRGVDDRAQLPLRGLQRGLGGAQLGDVDHHPLREERAAVGVADDRLLVPDMDDRAVGGDHAVLDVDRDLTARAAVDLLPQPLPVVRVDERLPEHRGLRPALRRVAGQPLDLGADVADRRVLVELADIRDGRDLLDELAVALLGLLARGLGGVHAGEVAQEGDEQRLVVDVVAGDGQLDRDLAAVAPHRAQLEPAAEDAGLAGGEVPRDRPLVRRAEVRRDDQLRDRPAARVGAVVSERALGGGVEVDDAALGVHRDDAVQRDVEDRRLA